MQGKYRKYAKKLAQRIDEMYKYRSRQIGIEDFEGPCGMRLDSENRWVKKAQMIPWDEIEQRYAKLFMNRKGNVAKPLRMALGSCIIQAEYDYPDEEIPLQIKENPYLQFFCGYSKYDDRKMPFDPSLMVHFRKRLTPEILGEINELIIANAEAKAAKEANNSTDDSQDDDHNDENNDSGNSNSGTMIVDATCAPSNIKHPTDASLLNEARENAEMLIDSMHTPGEEKPRTYRHIAHKDYLKLTRKRRPGAKLIRNTIGKQLNYLGRDLNHIKSMQESGKTLSEAQLLRLNTLIKVYEQQKYMHDNRTHSVPDRIVSISQPHIRPIVRGKSKAPVEFGAKLDISVVNGWTRLEVLSFDAYNEANKLKDMIERFRERTGHYPRRVLADKIYRNRENLSFCKEHNIHLSGPALGRPKKGEVRNKKQDYIEQSERIEVERRFSLAKRKCGLGLITAKLKETACHCIAMSIVVLNLRKIQSAFFDFLQFFVDLFLVVKSHRDFVIVQ